MKTREKARSSRVTPRPLWRRLASLASMFAVSLSIVASGVGCQTGGCGSCDLGNKIGNGVRATGATVRNLGSKVFHHKRGGTVYGAGAAAGCCGEPGMATEGVVDYGGGTPVGPGTIMPGPGTSTTTEPPAFLEPAPKGKTLPPEGSSANPTGSATKSVFESTSPRTKVRTRSNNVALTPAPATPARGLVTTVNPLDDLPPLEIPRPESSPTSAKSIEREALPAAATETQPVVPAIEPKSTESVSPPLPPPSTPAPPATAHATPGTVLKPLAVLEPGLAGGGVPSNEDMKRLVSLGYKTIIDLRNPEEVQSSFIACASNHGLRYVGLPVTLETLDSTRIHRFNLEIAQTEARPIFFFDTGGANAAALWSIRRQAIDKVDAQVARGDAEEIGVIDEPRAEAIKKYLATLKPAAVSSTEPDSTPAPVAATPIPEVALAPIAPLIPHSAAAWRPYAALALTGLGFPLAYWSRTASYGMSTPRASLASLPARVRALQALPHASGD